MTWDFPGANRLSGDHLRRDATVAVLGAYGEAARGTLTAKAIDVMASDAHVAGLANDTAKAKGKTLDVRPTVIFSMSDGKVTEARHSIDDVAAFDSFLG